MACRDFIFAVALTEQPKADGSQRFVDVVGSAFLLGNRGFALTAAHILPEETNHVLTAMFVVNDQWYGYAISNSEKHPDQDVAVLQIQNGPNRSPFRCRNRWEGSGGQYQQFGYPMQVAWETQPNDENLVLPNPELIYFQGYIRRRISTSLAISGIKGNAFFEVSEQAGRGCSGSPLYLPGNDLAWEIIGIYSAEITSTDKSGVVSSVAYAVREDCFRDWHPTLLSGNSIHEESLNVDITVN